MSVPLKTERGRQARWLLLSSLALNMVFVGAAGAVAIRYSSPVPLTAVSRIDHNLASRLNRIAEGLPPADAQIMLAQLRDDAEKLASAQADLRLSQDDVRKSLRAEPFDVAAVQAAMAKNRAAHDNYDDALHEMIAAAASRMSTAGRIKLADWPAQRQNRRQSLQ